MTPKSVGQRIRELREQAGWERPQLAVAAGVSVHALRDVELGRSFPGWFTACALADALGVSLDELRRPAAKEIYRKPGRPLKPRESE